jgi:hypothetical protein
MIKIKIGQIKKIKNKSMHKHEAYRRLRSWLLSEILFLSAENLINLRLMCPQLSKTIKNKIC